MKKVLLLAPMSSVHERFNKINIQILIQMNCELHIAANFEYGTEETIQHNLLYKKNLISEGIQVHQIPFQRSSFIKNLAAIQQCKKLFIKENFDLIHAHTETGGLITRLAMPGKRNTKYIFTPHGMSFYKGSSLISWILYYPLEKWICNSMDAVLAMNKEEYEVLIGWNKHNEKFIHGIGLDIDKIQYTLVNVKAKRDEFNIPYDAFLILSIGELNENKNHKTILKAISKIKNENVYYLICGEGPLKSYLEQIRDLYGLTNKVIFAGYRRDIIEIVHVANLFAFPSYHEGLPISVMEAMAASLPIVCSKIRGNTELIDDGQGGFLCDPDDIDSFAKNIETLIMDETLVAKMTKINTKKIINFSNKVVAKETEQIYQELLKS